MTRLVIAVTDFITFIIAMVVFEDSPFYTAQISLLVCLLNAVCAHVDSYGLYAFAGTLASINAACAGMVYLHIPYNRVLLMIILMCTSLALRVVDACMHD